MTQKTIKNPDHPRLEIGEESEDFSKIVKTTSGNLAIVDADLLKSIEHPAVKNAVTFPTKQTPGEEIAFIVKGEYDDATLRILVMKPASVEEVQEYEQKESFKTNIKGHDIEEESAAKQLIKLKERDVIPGGLADNAKDSEFDKEQLESGIKAELEHTSDNEIAKEIAKDHLKEDPKYYDKLKKMETEDIQIRGHDRVAGGLGSTVDKKISRILNKGGGDKGSRENRNRQDSATKGDPVDPIKHMRSKMAERVGSKNAASDNYGQPRKKEEPTNEHKVELGSFLKHVKDNTVTIQLLDNMQFTYQISEGLKNLRSLMMVDSQYSLNNLEIVCESCDILNDYLKKRTLENSKLIENLLRDGLPLV